MYRIPYEYLLQLSNHIPILILQRNELFGLYPVTKGEMTNGKRHVFQFRHERMYALL